MRVCSNSGGVTSDEDGAVVAVALNSEGPESWDVGFGCRIDYTETVMRIAPLDCRKKLCMLTMPYVCGCSC